VPSRVLCLVGLLVLAIWPASASAIDAGVGRSDVTPPTGFYTMGYVRSDSVARGQHTRLWARAIVLREGDRKVALVATDLGFTPGGLITEIAKRVKARGFSEENILVSASHTHSGPAGYANFGSDNFVAPTMGQPTTFSLATDARLYGFLVERITAAVVRADDDLGPARVGWGFTKLLGVTQNRSLEAHLANFGLDLAYGQGRVAQDPRGYEGTIDPNVDVLRVDRKRGRRYVPAGAWLNFANHGTVDPYNLGLYSADHHGHASRIFERGVRRAGHVPGGDEVVGAFGNGDAGDMSAALGRRGPAKSDEVGRAEADAMLRAWRSAGKRMSSRAPFTLRWNRVCWCGQVAGDGAVASTPSMGAPFLTGSEEGRGPLFEVTGVNQEGLRLPVDVGAQGRKVQALGPPAADFPSVVPLMVVRVGSGMIATVPGEMTVEMGRRTRDAVMRAATPLGIDQVALVGYANEYVHYFTTPEEYEWQAYEGGSTVFGRYSSNVLRDGLADLAGRLATGRSAPAAVPFDPRNGLAPDTTPYTAGADNGKATSQPGDVRRFGFATFKWTGGVRGTDRPLDRAFVRIERQRKGRWRAVTDDLGLEIVWRVDDQGAYTAQWQVPLSAPVGSYRFVVAARRYELASSPFRVAPHIKLHLRVVEVAHGKLTLALDYPPVDDTHDLTSHSASASSGRVQVRAGRRIWTVRGRGGRFVVKLRFRDARTVTVGAGLARDRYANRSDNAVAAVVPR
jgi:PAS domain-containing protein